MDHYFSLQLFKNFTNTTSETKQKSCVFSLSLMTIIEFKKKLI
jgi:hypothetical protein